MHHASMLESSAMILNLAYNFHTGLFTENCFVLAEGWYEDEVFHVNAFGFPPPESAKTTRYDRFLVMIVF